MRDLVTAGRLPGITMAIARHGEVEFIDSIGYLDVEHEVALQPDSVRCPSTRLWATTFDWLRCGHASWVAGRGDLTALQV